MRIISCPKNKWLDLVTHMQKDVYVALIQEPDVSEVEETIGKNCPTITREDMESTLQFIVSQHNEDMIIRSKIENNYGDTYTEAVGTLKEHVHSCPGCKTEYLRALDSYTESMENVKAIAIRNRVCDSEDYLDKISRYDFLKLLKKGL